MSFGSDVPHAWLHFRGDHPGPKAEIRGALERAGVCLHDQDACSTACPGIVCFVEFGDDLLAALREWSREGSRRMLAVAANGCTLRPSETWHLLHAGAADLLFWDGGEAGVSQIKARLERWAAIEELAASPAVHDTLVGESPEWLRLVGQIVEAAQFTQTPILLTGESGTGKELLARLVHALGNGANRELVTLDCTTIVPELAGSELFGHEKGAFTGAAGLREGAFALANGGTLFLDEVGELPLGLQAQLLRVVQERTYKRVGGNAWHSTEFRLVCATNRDLKEQVARGEFRLDLYYRIAGWVFRTLPLRERREDILPLSVHFLRTFLGKDGASDFDSAVRQYLVTRDYPGNIRDLRQLIQRLAYRHVGAGPVTAGDVPEGDRPQPDESPACWPGEHLRKAVAQAVAMGAGLREIAQATTEAAIRIAVQSEQGNLQKAAKRLGITDRALQMRKAAGKF
jgi:transcriptional regulator with GAF, ATPase, and Fis domain